MEQLDGRPVTTVDLRALALVGLGHFTTMRVERGRVRGLRLHLQRLDRDGRRLFGRALDEDLVRERIRGAIADEPADVLVRVTVFDPALSLARPGADASPSILVSPRPAEPAPAPPLHARSVRYTRDLPEVKHTGLFGAMLARRTAQRGGFDDAVLVDAHGRLVEGPTWNLGFVRAGRVMWPDGPALAGVTRELLAAADAATEAVHLEDVPTMDAAFATGSGTGIRPLAGIDDTRWDPAHPVLAALDGTYRAIEPDPV